MELTVQLTESTSPLQVRLKERSDVGNRPENQDAVGHRQVGDWWCCVLADGAGGHSGGEVAARLAVNVILEQFASAPTLDKAQFSKMVNWANDQILLVQRGNPNLFDMHTTVCLLVLNQRSGEAGWLHVGDSRLYHFRGDQTLARTKDHSVWQWMVDTRQNNIPPTRNALYTALGEPTDQLHVEISECVKVRPGDWFLLCSDGLWEHFSEGELALLGANFRDVSVHAEHMHQLGLSRANGCADNMSSITLFID